MLQISANICRYGHRRTKPSKSTHFEHRCRPPQGRVFHSCGEITELRHRHSGREVSGLRDLRVSHLLSSRNTMSLLPSRQVTRATRFTSRFSRLADDCIGKSADDGRADKSQQVVTSAADKNQPFTDNDFRSTTLEPRMGVALQEPTRINYDIMTASVGVCNQISG